MQFLFRVVFVCLPLGLAACAAPTPAAIAIASSGLTPATIEQPKLVLMPGAVAVAIAKAPESAATVAAEQNANFVQFGNATWYGKKFHGRQTASGEIYDMNGLTAAHAELPMGTVVQVTNLDNGRSLRLRVNDRLPAKTAILDVSARAARELGFHRAGRADVRIESETNLALAD